MHNTVWKFYFWLSIPCLIYGMDQDPNIKDKKKTKEIIQTRPSSKSTPSKNALPISIDLTEKKPVRPTAAKSLSPRKDEFKTLEPKKSPTLEAHRKSSPRKWKDKKKSPRKDSEEDEERARSISPKRTQSVMELNKRFIASDPTPSPSKRSHLTSSFQSRQSKPSENAILYQKLNVAIQKNDSTLIEKFLFDCENPNIQNPTTENTLLHQAVLITHKSIVDILLRDSRINSLILNKDGRAAIECMQPASIITHQSLYKSLQLRKTLDHVINAMILTDEKILTEECPNNYINQKINRFLNNISHGIVPDYTDAPFMLAMIRARLQYNKEIFQIIGDHYLSNPNFQDDCGNTLLHHAVYLRDKNMIERLIQNPKISSLKKNRENLLPQGILHSLEQKVTDIRMMLFMRDTIERSLPTVAEAALFRKPHLKTAYSDPKAEPLNPNSELIKEIIECLEETLETVKRNQEKKDIDKIEAEEDGQMPDPTVNLPAYVTNEFIFESVKPYMMPRIAANNEQKIINEIETAKLTALPSENSISLVELDGSSPRIEYKKNRK